MAGRLLALIAAVGLAMSCGAQPSPSVPASGASPDQATLAVQQADIARHLDALARIADDNGGIRAAGTPGYDASASYVAEQLVALGYSVQRSPLELSFFEEAAPVTLAVGGRTWSGAEWLHAMLYSASGSAAASVQAVGIAGGTAAGGAGCDRSDWADFAAGNIALVLSGPCLRRDQVMLAQQAGAAALVALYPGWAAGQAKRPTLIDPGGIDIPAIAAGQEPAEALLAAADSGATVRVEVRVTLTPATSESVIGELAGGSERVVMLGGHLDSVLDGPGINDNGSGVATVLAIAATIAARGTPRATVRVALWTGEEFGDLGSSAWVRSLDPSQLARIDAYLNLDMVGSPNAARFVYDDTLAAPGSAQLRDALLDALGAMGRPGIAEDLGGASDHYAFEVAGIATGGVFSGLAPLTDEQARTFGGEAGVPADACYHLVCDGRDNVNLQSAVTLGQAVAQVVAELAL
jgi:Zn-dependent M28 family amino/carboxypeptidase